MKFLYLILPAFTLFISASASSQPLEQDLSGFISITVDAEGAGDYTTVTEAINAAPNYSATRVVIFIRDGEYYEKIDVSNSKTNLTLVGESIDGTVIVYDDYSGKVVNGVEIGTSTSHSMITHATEFTVMNLTIKNSSGQVGQAVALNLKGDRQAVIRCRLMGFQDTFYTWGEGRYLVKDSYIEGNVDFIFGRGAVYFDSCQINSNRSNSDITAASTDANWKFGYVFDHCKLTANPGITGVTLGRPWKEYAQTVFINSKLGKHISADGWSEWGGNTNHETAYYAEYENLGEGWAPAQRVDWAHILTAQEAEKYTMENVFKNDVKPSPFSTSWTPDFDNDQIYQIIKNHTEHVFADTLFNKPVLKSLAYQGIPVEEFDPENDFFYVIQIPASVSEIDLNDIAFETLDPQATVQLTPPNQIPGNTQIKVTSRNGATLNYVLRMEHAPLGLDPESQIGIYPNPASDHLIVDAKAFEVSVLNLAGQSILTKKPATNSFPTHLDLNQIPPGMYLLQIDLPSGVVYRKFVKK